jgi:hypothetical protein
VPAPDHAVERVAASFAGTLAATIFLPVSGSGSLTGLFAPVSVQFPFFHGCNHRR